MALNVQFDGSAHPPLSMQSNLAWLIDRTSHNGSGVRFGVGAVVGLSVGDIVGLTVGDIVGLAVGDIVGAAIGVDVSTP